MKQLTVKIPIDEIADAVAVELRARRDRADRASIAPTSLGFPTVESAIANVIRAVDRVDRDQHSRGEQAALAALFKAGKTLRYAVQHSEKETQQ